MSDQSLHERLASVAERVVPVDLYERSLRRSAQIRRRNIAASLASGLVVLILLGVAGLRFLPSSQPLPLPPASPSAAVRTSPNTSPDPNKALPPPALVNVTADFKNAILPIPDWPHQGPLGNCATGPITFVNGAAATAISLGVVYSTPLGGQPAYLAMLACIGPSQGSVSQLIAYRRGNDGRYSYLATVVRVDHPGGATSSTSGITSVESVESVGVDRLRLTVVQNTVAGSSVPRATVLSQVREYRWTGTAFVQSAGPASFIADPAVAAVTVSSGPMTVNRPTAQGCRTATLTISVHNQGPQAANLNAAVFYPYATPAPAACQAPSPPAFGASVVPIGSIAAGETTSVTLTVVVGEPRGSSVVDQPEDLIQLRTGDQRYADTTRYVIEYAQ